MTILYYWKDDNESMSSWQHYHLIHELKLKHEVLIFDINKFDFINQEFSNNFKLFCNKNKTIDLFITCLHQDYLSSEILDIVDSLGVPKLLISFDNLHAPFMHLGVANRFDLVWVTSHETEYLFRKKGVKTLFLPYAANPGVYIAEKQPIINRTCFIGSPYGTRPILLNKISRSGVKLDVYYNQRQQDNYSISFRNVLKESVNCLSFGIGRKVLWSSLKVKYQSSNIRLENSISMFDSVSFEEMYRLFKSYSIVLNLTELRNTAILKNPVLKLHFRTFEIPAAGGLQLVKRSDELLSYFRDNEEILTYDSTDELISKASFFSKESQSNTIDRMRIKARTRVINEHTWTHRFDKIFSVLFN
jgi:spore maturation protein CgeB